MLFYFILFTLQIVSISNQDVTDIFCCAKATGSCRSICNQMYQAAIDGKTEIREKKLKSLRNLCPSTMVVFWKCLTDTLRDIERGDSWSGRQCCPIPYSKLCQNACLQSYNRNELLSDCRRSDELDFFDCLDRAEEGDDCCGQAKSPNCLQICQEIFKSRLTPKKDQRTALLFHCDTSPKVIQCARNLTNVTPIVDATKYTPCCDKSSSSECRETCKMVLKTRASQQEILDDLQESCGFPLPHDEFWQCFLKGGVPMDKKTETTVARIGKDAAKLHCCSRATSLSCRRLCVETFSDKWMASWQNFSQECLNSMAEDRLQICIDEVEEPCELGCDGLNYCSSFNNRPTDLFRSCTVLADEAARHDVHQWIEDGMIRLPGVHGVELALKNVSRCSPEKWKAVACTMQIKPCHPETHGTRICKNDCYDMLSSCVDWARMRPGQTVASLCNRLTSGVPNAPCITLADFSEPRERNFISETVSAPCNYRPCDYSELCVINRNCNSRKSCQTYECMPGCRLGEASKFVVPTGTLVRLPVEGDHKGCVKVCSCTENQMLEKCQPLPCSPTEDCWVGNKKYSHGVTFRSECNLCSCYSGELTCGKRQCLRGSEGSKGLTLPCNCPAYRAPVCGKNGNTYPNQCLARCAGLTEMDFEDGECSDLDPCENSPCSEDLTCVPMRKVCLSLLESPCVQYICVDPNAACSEQPRNAVCDEDQQEHRNLCYMVRAGRTLAHVGSCLLGCSTEGVVCGVDGVTYTSECHAFVEYSAVDYPGSCQTVGMVSTYPRAVCSEIECPSLPHEGCDATTPPGACCPVCAGALRLLFSRKQVDRALYALQGISSEALSVKGVMKALHRQIKVTECKLWGYLTTEGEIFVAVVAVNGASRLQREVCVQEAEKISSHIRRGSPRYLTEVSLSVLTASTPVHTSAFSSATFVKTSFFIFPLLLWIF